MHVLQPFELTILSSIHHFPVAVANYFQSIPRTLSHVILNRNLKLVVEF
jgi:hypothetical protein